MLHWPTQNEYKASIPSINPIAEMVTLIITNAYKHNIEQPLMSEIQLLN